MIRKDDIIDEREACVPSVGDEARPIAMSADAEKAEKELEKIAPADKSGAIKTKNTSKNFAITLLFIAVNVLAVVLTALMEFSGGEEPVPFIKVWRVYIKNWGWMLGAFGMFVAANVCQSIKRHLFLKSTLNKKLPIISMNATLLCKYYDNITPLGSGGQPFEIYYLRKKGIPVGVASGVPLVSYALDRIAYVFIVATVLITYGFGEISTFLTILCIIGLVINAAIPAALLFFSVLPKTAESVAGFVSRIAKALHLTKDAELFKHKITDSIKEYAECIKYFLKKSKLRMFVGFLLSALYFLTLYSIPFFTIRMSGTTGIRWGEIFSLCVICYTSVAILPTPGGSGGAELSFRSIFARFLQGGKLFWGIMSWRLFSYYLSIFVGIVLIIGQSIFKLTKSGKLERARAKKAFENSVIRPKATDSAAAAQAGDYTPAVVPAPTIIGDEPEVSVVSAETIINEADEKPLHEKLTVPDAEHIIHVEAVISPKDGLTVTEIKTPEAPEKSDEKSDSGVVSLIVNDNPTEDACSDAEKEGEGESVSESEKAEEPEIEVEREPECEPESEELTAEESEVTVGESDAEKVPPALEEAASASDAEKTDKE